MIKKMFNSNFFKSLLVLASGSVLGTLIIAFCEIARTWIFPKDLIGVFSFLVAVPLTFISITSLRYDISIVIEDDERKAIALVKLSFILSIVVSILVTIGFLIYIIGFHQEYIEYLYVTPIIPIIMMGYGSNNILNSYNNRYKEYKTISKKYVVRTTVQYVVAIVLGFILVKWLQLYNLSVFIMMFPYGIGLFVGVKNQASGLIKRKHELKSITKNEMIQVAKKHRRQLYFSTPALFVNSYSFSIITFLIEDLFDTTILAFYSLSNRVLGMPISLISGNVAKVYIEEASKEFNKTGKFINAFKKSFLFLFAMSIPMFLAMYFIAPPLCTMLLGQGWSVSGEYIKILALMFSFRLIGTAISQSLAVCNKQGWELVINGSLIIASVISGIVTRLRSEDIYYFLKALCLSRSLCYIGLIILVFILSMGVGQSKNIKIIKEKGDI